MSKKATQATQEKNPTTVEMEIPTYDERVSQGWQGTKAKPLGYGIMEATGKDGITKGWVVSVLAIRENGKAKYTALQNVAATTAKAYAKVYNPYTGLYKTEIAALRKASACAEAFNGYLLGKEAERIEELKEEGEWKEKKEETKKKPTATPSERIADAVNAITEKTDDKIGAFCSALPALDVIRDYNAGIVEIMKAIESAHGAGVLDGVIDTAVDVFVASMADAIKKTADARKADKASANADKMNADKASAMKGITANK